MRFNITVGDWSGDGHGETEHFVIEATHTLEEVQEAYKKAVADFGFDLQSFCEDYEDNTIPVDFAEKLIHRGIREREDDDWSSFWESWNDREDDDDDICVNAKDFVRIILFMVAQHLPNFHYDILEDDAATWHVGGYGLFAA